MVSDLSVGLDKTTKMGRLSIQESFMDLNKFLEVYKELNLFTQYQCELFWFKGITEKDITREKLIIPKYYGLFDQFLIFLKLKKEETTEETWINITIPFERMLIIKIDKVRPD